MANRDFWRTQDVAELRTVLDQNSNALVRLRGALDKQWAVPISFGDTNSFPSLMSHLAPAKGFAQLFSAEGRLAELEGRTNDALAAYTQCIRLGQKLTHGSLMIQDLVGIACKAIGTKELHRIFPAASDTSLRHVLNDLAVVDQSNQSVEEVIRRDRDWARSDVGWLRFIGYTITSRSAMRQNADSIRAKHLRSEAEVRLLRSAIALELFRRESGGYPAGLSELVPRHLETVPVDPFNCRPMPYHRTTNSYLLYSIGPDHKDDGGKPAPGGHLTPGFFGGSFEVKQGDLVSSPPLGL